MDSIKSLDAYVIKSNFSPLLLTVQQSKNRILCRDASNLFESCSTCSRLHSITTENDAHTSDHHPDITQLVGSKTFHIIWTPIQRYKQYTRASRSNVRMLSQRTHLFHLRHAEI